MKVAIIDSGINADVFPNTLISQYIVYNGCYYKEKARDYIGHGTAVASIIIDENTDIEILSICPGISPSGVPDTIIDIKDIAAAIEIAIQENADVINISMGTTMFMDRHILDDVCFRAAASGIMIFAAEPSKGVPSLPWGCCNVYRVSSIPGKDHSIVCQTDSEHYSLAVRGELFRIKTKENKKHFASGSSYAAPYIISKLIENQSCHDINGIIKLLPKDVNAKEYISNMLDEKIELINDELDFILEEKHYGNIVLVPFGKEMHSLIRYNGDYNYNVVGAVDSVKKGTVNKDTGDLIGIGSNNIKVFKNITDISEKVDTLVIGHLDEISKYDKKFSLEYILEENYQKTKWNIFSFIPVPYKWQILYKEKGLRIDGPPLFNDLTYKRVCEVVKYKSPISKPVVGVFGTSSSQGKFTLQVALKQALEERNCRCFYLSTENHGAFMNAGVTFSDGYRNDHTIDLGCDQKIDLLRRIMVYIDNKTDSDLIITGGQSRLIPYNVNENTFIRSATFLEGVLPDLAIVVINPLTDVSDYIKDTINALKSVYKCTTFALAFSDYTVTVDDSGRFTKKKLSSVEIVELSQNFSSQYNILCGCITDSTFISLVANEILEICK